MKTTETTIVRIYVSEGHAQLDKLLKRMHDLEHARGLTVFRGISGYGDSGEIHSAKLIDLAMDLPLVLEFFDEPTKAQEIIEHLSEIVKPGHMIWWTVNSTMPE